MELRRDIGWILSSGLLVVVGCAHAPPAGPLRIDGSTPAAFQTSWDRMHRSLTPSQQGQLDVAVLQIAMGQYKSFNDIPPSFAGVGPQDIRAQVDGMTFEQIAALAKSEPVKVSLPRSR
jgi:hypothetical protein